MGVDFLTMFYAEFCDDGLMHIKELSKTEEENRNSYDKRRGTYRCVPLFNTLEETIQSLKYYGQPIVMLNGDIKRRNEYVIF